MKRSNTRTIGQVIEQLIEAYKIRGKISEAGVINYWEELLGKGVASETSKIYMKKRVLFVHVNSSVLRNELFMMRDSIKEKLNEKAGEKIIDSVVFR
ncbi:MAG: DUF721 domain-containing protein [Bacteroidota bacterium]